MLPRFAVLFVMAVAPVPAGAVGPAALETKVRAVFDAHCYRCHSHQAGKSKGQLMLDARALLLKGGESGPAVVPGDADRSLLVRAVEYADDNLQMPPKGKLAADEIALLREWVQAGAPWTDAPTKQAVRTPGTITAEDRRYWAFQPVKAPPLPAGTVKHPVDRFIGARLASEGLTPAPPADRRALIRRVTFDLTGLPPTPAEVESFVADPAPNAYEKLVDRLLASPHYGERQARAWLDVVRYAESDGFRHDAYRPAAWPYRDYVVRAFNADRPFDRFVREQLAGDELHPDDADALAATGFLTLGIYEYNQRNVRGQWNDLLNEVADVTGEALLGLGMGCARCHDHKFDPILQRDYFALRAFFEGLLPADDRPLATAAQQAAHAKQQAVWLDRTTTVRAAIDAIEAPERAKVEASMVAKFPADIQAMLRTPPAKRSPLEHQLATLAYRQVQYEYDKLDTRIKGEAKDRLLALRQALKKFDADRPAALATCFAVREVGPAAPPTLIPKKTATVGPAFLTVLGEPAPTIKALPALPSTGRRSALARWLTRPDHPLTARVFVNRVWQGHFGRGLVATANDWGHLGERPSHPDLLDWLADRFVNDAWSVKKLHRLIVTSRTYQQSATAPADPVALQKDPENRLLGRMTPRRLEAEPIRDALLTLTGALDRIVGGPSVEHKQPRRSLYLKALRNTREPVLEVFDLPEAFGSTAGRNVTTTAPQALLLMNSPLMRGHAAAFADRLAREEPSQEDVRIDRAFRLVFGRAATQAEIRQALDFLKAQAGRVKPAAAAEPEVARLPFREGNAAVLTPGGPQARFEAPARLPTDRFTVEGFVSVRSVNEDGTVRTIASHWDGDPKGMGWVFGVTGKKSAYKAQTLVLQLWGHGAAGKPAYEALFSGLSLQLNRPYYVAVSVNLADPTEAGITFYARDLANDEDPVQTYAMSHKVVAMPRAHGTFVIGGTPGGKADRGWDGLIDDVRLSRAVLAPAQLLLSSGAMTPQTVGFWQFEPRPGMLHDSSPAGLHLHRRGAAEVAAAVADPHRAAWVDLCLVLMNANEFLYVD